MGSTPAGPGRSVFARHPGLTLAAINLVLALLALAAVELSLRRCGAKTIHDQVRSMPSYLPPDFCEATRRRPLVVQLPFVTDTDGIFKANKEFFEAHPAWAGPGVRINDEGYRGGEFRPGQNGRTSILLLGDSFTWGASARPLTKSFADRLADDGYQVFNTGIPGVDPEQYARIARKYVPRLRPGITAVFLFMGNDIAPSPMVVEPNRNLWHVTNFGFLLGYDESGRYFDSAAQALQHYRRTYCGDPEGLAERMLDRTAIGAVLQQARARWRAGTHPDTSRAWVRRSLSEIREVCTRQGSRFVLFLIPAKPSQQGSYNSIPENLSLFEGFDPQFPHRLSEKDYRGGDDHFNNTGHRKYFQFVRKVLAR